VNEYEAADDVVSEAEPPFPWPPAEGEPIVSGFGRTWRGACLEPRSFFAAMPHDGIGSALLYYLAIGIAVAGGALFWSTVFASFPDEGVMGKLAGGTWNPIVEFMLSPLILILSIFLAAGFTHLMLLMFGGAGGGFAVTLRVFAFAYSPQILGIIPVVGQIAGFFWMVAIAIIGLSAAHRTTTGRAAAAVLTPLILMIGFLVMIAVFFLAAGGLV